jgi:hypothetical protein
LYQRLLERFPTWHRFAEIAGDEASKVPQPGSDRSLWISTEDDEVTIGFDKWHCHESAWLGDDEASVEADIVRRSIELIEDILDEREVVIVRFRDGTWVGSNLEAACDEIEAISGEVARVFSWRGTLDRVIT